MEQVVYQESSEEELNAMQMYGFGNKRSGVFARLQVRLRRPLPPRPPLLCRMAAELFLGCPDRRS